MNVTIREAKMLNNIANSCYGDFSILNPDHNDSQSWAFVACNDNDSIMIPLLQKKKVFFVP